MHNKLQLKYPQFMVDEEIEHILQSVQKDLKQQNLDFETYLKLMKTDREKYIDENVRPAAEKRLVNSLIIDKFAQEEKIEIAKEDVDSIMSNTVQMMENNPNPKGKKGKVSSQEINSVAYNAMTRLYNQRTMERMKFIASGEIDKVDTTEETEEKPEDQLENVVVEEIEPEGTLEESESKPKSDLIEDDEPEESTETTDDKSEISEEE